MGIKDAIPQDLWGLLKAGFNVTAPVNQGLSENPQALEAMIAVAAYYKAEKRNFKPGYDVADWLEAKKEIVRQLYGNRPAPRHSEKASNHRFEKQICC